MPLPTGGDIIHGSKLTKQWPFKLSLKSKQKTHQNN